MRQKLRYKKAVSTLALLAFLQVPFCYEASYAAETVNVRGGVHSNANRLVFDFRRTPKYELKQDGEWVSVIFSTAVDFSRDASARKLSRLTDFSSETSGDQTTVRFRVAPDAKVKDLISGSYVVIDVNGDVPAAETKEKPELKVAQAGRALDQLAQKANGPKIILGETVAAVTAPASGAAPAETATILGTLDAPVSLVQLPAAIFQRGDSAYIVFDRRVKFRSTAPDTSIAAIDGGAFTGYRLPGISSRRIGLSRTDKQWQLTLDSGASATRPFAVPKVEPHYALGARVFVPMPPVTGTAGTAATAPVLSFIDPGIGDTLFVVPYTAPRGVESDRHFVDFDLLASDQGVVVRPLNDKLTLRQLEAGVEIGAPGGLRLTDADRIPADEAPPPAATPATEQAPAEPGPVATPQLPINDQKLFFDFGNWRQRDRESFDDARRRLQTAILGAPEDARNRFRLDMARLYLANGYGKETRGLLTMMATEEEGGFEDLAGQPEFRTLQAAAEMLSGNQSLAWPVLSNPALNDYDDIRLWRAASLAESHKFDEAAGYFDQSVDLLKIYPEPLFSRFALLAAETYVALGQYPKATTIIDQLAARTRGAALRWPQVLYLRGVLQSRTGTFDAARKLWEEAGDSTDQMSRVRARFALVDLNLASKTITPQAAADELERLRFGWRGDDLELQILNRLGDIYVSAGQPEEALKAFERAKNIFPEPGRDAVIVEKQRKIFFDFFNSPQLESYPPLKVLSLYNRYKDYAPADPAQRKLIADRLIGKMLAMDLLPQAAGLLAQQMADEADPAAKSKAGAQLAGIKLLDRKPDEALKALTDSEAAYDTAGAGERKLLRARALADKGNYQDALNLLGDDTSEGALRLKATVAWQARQWPAAAAALAALLPGPPAARLTAEQSQIIVNRAVALNLAGDQAGVTKVAADFGEAMKATPQAGTFSILTDPEKVAGNLAALGTQAKGVDLFQSFLETYRKK